MTLTINILAETEKRLKCEAARLGVDEAEYARRLIERGLPSTELNNGDATLKLLQQWDTEDQTSDPEEIVRRDRELADLKESLNRNRAEAGGAHARKVFP